jgi:hypothetical protein
VVWVSVCFKRDNIRDLEGRIALRSSRRLERGREREMISLSLLTGSEQTTARSVVFVCGCKMVGGAEGEKAGDQQWARSGSCTGE